MNNNVEKIVVWVIALALVILGALSAYQDSLPRSVSIVLTVVGSVLAAVERFLTLKTP